MVITNYKFSMDRYLKTPGLSYKLSKFAAFKINIRCRKKVLNVIKKIMFDKQGRGGGTSRRAMIT